MATLRVTSAIFAAIILAGCAATAVDTRGKAAKPAAVAINPACLNQTASRIPSSGANCSAMVRSYTNDDIMRTGQSSLGDALALLDPSITVHK